MPDPRFTHDESRDTSSSDTKNRSYPSESDETCEEFRDRLKKKEEKDAEEDSTRWYHD